MRHTRNNRRCFAVGDGDGDRFTILQQTIAYTDSRIVSSRIRIYSRRPAECAGCRVNCRSHGRVY